MLLVQLQTYRQEYGLNGIYLYVEDCAGALVLATERYAGPEPVNLGVGVEIRIKDLVELIAELTGFQGQIGWDTSKPNGQARHCLDTRRAWEWFGFRAKTELREGIGRTIAWYVAEKGEKEAHDHCRNQRLPWRRLSCAAARRRAGGSRRRGTLSAGQALGGLPV